MEQLISIGSHGLTDEEQVLLAYLLTENMRTFKSYWGVPVLRSLVIKGILTESGGVVNAIPFSINERVWEYLQEIRQVLLPDKVANDPQAISELQNCVKTLVQEAMKDKEITQITYGVFARHASGMATYTKDDTLKILGLNRKSKIAQQFKTRYFAN